MSRFSIINWLIFISLVFIWGSAYILMKKGLQVFEPTQVAALRLVIAAVCLLPFSIPLLIKTRKYPWVDLAIVALTANLLPAFLFTLAQTNLSSSVVGTLNSLTPLFTLVIAYFVFKEKFTKPRIYGVVLGLIGAFSIFFAIPTKTTTESSDYRYGLLVIIATVMYGININVVKKKLLHLHTLTLTSLSMIVAGVPSLIYLITTDYTLRVTTHPSGYEALGYIVVLSVFGTALATLLFYFLVQRTSALFGASGVYLTPFVAIGWGVLDGEALHYLHFVGLGAILLGVYLINRELYLKNKKKTTQINTD